MSWSSLFPLELVLHVLDYTTPEATINLARTCKKLYNHQKIDTIFDMEFDPIVQKIRCNGCSKLVLRQYAGENGRTQYAMIMKTIREYKKATDKEMLKSLAWAIVEHPLDVFVEWYGGTGGAVFAAYLSGIRLDTITVPLPILCLSTLVLSRPVGEIAKHSLVMARNLCCTLTLPALLFKQIFNMWSKQYSIWTFSLMGTFASMFATRSAWFASIKQVWNSWDNRAEHRQFMAAWQYHKELVKPTWI